MLFPAITLDRISFGAVFCINACRGTDQIPPKIAVSSFMGYLKGKSATMIYEQFGDLKYKYRNREFWCKGYYVDTVGKNEARITEYVRNQLKEDEMSEQMVIPDVRPFKGSK